MGDKEMTNGEKLCIDFPNMRYTISEHRVITTIGVAASFDLDWWNEEYKEPTTKNDLVVDFISRADVIRAIEDVLQSDNCDYDLIEFLADLKDIPSVTPQEPRWIPISERLPASYEEVLVTNGVGTYVGWIDPTDRCWRVDSKSEYFIDEMLAWMPLPKPYSEVEE